MPLTTCFTDDRTISGVAGPKTRTRSIPGNMSVVHRLAAEWSHPAGRRHAWISVSAATSNAGRSALATRARLKKHQRDTECASRRAEADQAAIPVAVVVPGVPAIAVLGRFDCPAWLRTWILYSPRQVRASPQHGGLLSRQDHRREVATLCRSPSAPLHQLLMLPEPCGVVGQVGVDGG